MKGLYRFRTLAVSMGVLLLAACSAEQQELAQWMEQQRKEDRKSVV